MLYCAMFLSGLMGNFNGEKSDDFSLPDGTNVGNASAFTEQEIYDFGRNCKITIYSISISSCMLYFPLLSFYSLVR